jgi:hypothetical protein
MTAARVIGDALYGGMPLRFKVLEHRKRGESDIRCSRALCYAFSMPFRLENASETNPQQKLALSGRRKVVVFASVAVVGVVLATALIHRITAPAREPNQSVVKPQTTAASGGETSESEEPSRIEESAVPASTGSPNVGGKFEAEDLQIFSASRPGMFRRVEAADASGGARLMIDTANMGDFIGFRVPKIAAGGYSVRIGVHKVPSGGIIQTVVAAAYKGYDDDLGPPLDQYTTTGEDAELIAGNWSPTTTNDKVIKFTVVGKNPRSQGMAMCIDYIKMVPRFARELDR